MNCLFGFFITFLLSLFMCFYCFCCYIFLEIALILLSHYISGSFENDSDINIKKHWSIYECYMSFFFFISLQYSVNHFILPQTGNMFYIVFDNLLEFCLIIHWIVILSTIYGVLIIYLYLYKNVYKDTFITLSFTISSNSVFLIRCSLLLNF